MRAGSSHYPAPLRILHWCMALCVITQLALALLLPQLRSLAFGQQMLFMHQQVGIALLCLMLTRVVVGWFHRSPKGDPSLPTWQHRAASLLHFAVFILLVAQPLVGIATAWARGDGVSLLGLATVGSPIEFGEAAYGGLIQAHVAIAAAILALVVAHVGAVVFNRAVRGVNVMERMLSPLRAGELRNRMAVGLQLTLAFGAVLGISLCSGVFAVSKYREVTSLQTALQSSDVAAVEAARSAQVSWKEVVGGVRAGGKLGGDDEVRLREAAAAARSSVADAVGLTRNAEARLALEGVGKGMAATVTGRPWIPGEIGAIDVSLQEAYDSLSAALFQARTDYDEQAARGQDLVVVAVLPMLLAGCLVAVVLARSITGSFARMRALVQAVTAGELQSELKVVGSGELSTLMREMLAMGAAVERRTAAAAENQRNLEIEHARLLDVAREREAAELARNASAQAEAERRELQERERAIEQQRDMREREMAARAEAAVQERKEREQHRRALAEEFETQVSSLIDAASSTVDALTSAADELAGLAGGSVERSREATTVARQTNATAAEIAAGADRLMDAATTARAQAERSRSESLVAVDEAAEASATLRDLIQAVRQISGITEMIADISRQSEMLGINARIEAARAGDAGRGFAVVATDVKVLASRTRDATASIGAQIEAVNRTATQSAEFLTKLGLRIGTLGSTAATILASSETQHRYSAEIAGGLSRVTQSTEVVAGSVGAAEVSAATTADLAATVQAAAQFMEQQTRQMQERVAAFVLAIHGGAESAAVSSRRDTRPVADLATPRDGTYG